MRTIASPFLFLSIYIAVVKKETDRKMLENPIPTMLSSFFTPWLTCLPLIHSTIYAQGRNDQDRADEYSYDFHYLKRCV